MTGQHTETLARRRLEGEKIQSASRSHSTYLPNCRVSVYWPILSRIEVCWLELSFLPRCCFCGGILWWPFGIVFYRGYTGLHLAHRACRAKYMAPIRRV